MTQRFDEAPLVTVAEKLKKLLRSVRLDLLMLLAAVVATCFAGGAGQGANSAIWRDAPDAVIMRISHDGIAVGIECDLFEIVEPGRIRGSIFISAFVGGGSRQCAHCAVW